MKILSIIPFSCFTKGESENSPILDWKSARQRFAGPMSGPAAQRSDPRLLRRVFQSETGSLAFPYDKMKYQRIGGEEDGIELAGLGETASGHRPGGIGLFEGCL
jgi:hypothetical protein